MATFTTLQDADVRGLLDGYNLPDYKTFSGVPAGSVNSNFAVETASARYFLRVYEEQDRAGAEAEARLLTSLADRGVSTPKPVARKDGGVISDVRGKPAALFPWISGSIRCQESVSPEDAEKVGAALARVHTAGEGLPRGAGRFNEADLRARLVRIAAADDRELAAQAAPLGASLDRWTRARKSLRRGLIHGDLFRDNVLWSDAGDVAALLDFESASDGVLAYDLMVTILAWCVTDDLELELAQAMARGYTSVRKLDEAEKAGLVAEGCLAAVRFSITRITDYAMRGEVGPRVVKDYRRFLLRLRRLEKIADTVGEGGLAVALDL